MIICLCNALSESEIVAQASSSGATSATDLYAQLGCRPRCGRCLDYVTELLDTPDQPVAHPEAAGALAAAG